MTVTSEMTVISLLFHDRQMQVEREGLPFDDLFQRTDVLLQPLLSSVTIFALLHPFDQLLPCTGDIHSRVLHLQAGDCI